MFDNISRLFGHISVSRRRALALVFGLMVTSSFAEMFALGSLLPFLGALTAPEKVYSQEYLQPLVKWLNIDGPNELLVPLTVIFCFAGIISGVMRVMLLWLQTRLSYSIGSDLSIKLYSLTLYQPYSAHVMQNSSTVIAGLSKVVSVVSGTVNPFLNIISSSLLLSSILFSLFLIDSSIASLAIFGFGFIYLSIVFLTKKILMKDGQIISQQQNLIMKYLHESLGGIRDILIDRVQPLFIEQYTKADLSLRKAQGNIQIIGGAPRYLIESLSVVFIAVLAFSMMQDKSKMALTIPMLAILALAAQRMLPLFQQIYSGWSIMRGAQASLLDVLRLLDKQPSGASSSLIQAPLNFSNRIHLENVSFAYEDERLRVLDCLNLTINRGDRIGVIGQTGSGKSTLIDIIMGLLRPSSGEILVDGVKLTPSNIGGWQEHISHVPQSIFLADATIAENIAFGVSPREVELEEVKLAAEKSSMATTIEGWPNGYKTIIGERGIRLSGGQRQRIGIARALYKKSSLLILDEATSALDDKSEEAVMATIRSLDKNYTLIIIAHRLTTLRDCTKIVEIEGGRIKRLGSYDEIIGNNRELKHV